MGRLSANQGRLTADCVNVMMLINLAYVIYADGPLKLPGGRTVPIEGGPGWLRTGSYTIEAKSAGAASSREIGGPMLRALLEDRFKLKIHAETREVPVYALAVAKGGAKLEASTEGSCVVVNLEGPPAQTAPVPAGGFPPMLCGIPRVTKGSFELRGVTMAELGSALRLDREVIDRTGIAGRYDVRVALGPGMAAMMGMQGMVPAPGGPGVAPAPPPPTAVEPGDALVAAQAVVEKLGLKLEGAKGPGKFLVIDAAERPGEN
jgi:uncharacterized protein (TIGR03435 family)